MEKNDFRLPSQVLFDYIKINEEGIKNIEIYLSKAIALADIDLDETSPNKNLPSELTALPVYGNEFLNIRDSSCFTNETSKFEEFKNIFSM